MEGETRAKSTLHPPHRHIALISKKGKYLLDLRCGRYSSFIYLLIYVLICLLNIMVRYPKTVFIIIGHCWILCTIIVQSSWKNNQFHFQ